MENNISVQAVRYIVEHEAEMVQMLCAFWKFADCRENEEKEQAVFEEYKDCFGAGVDYVSYALTLREVCSTGEYCGLLQNKMNVSVSDENRYLHTLLYGVLCEWWKSCSRRKVVRCFLSFIPEEYVEQIWRKAGAELNNIPEEDVEPEMLWKYPKRENQVMDETVESILGPLKEELKSNSGDEGKGNEDAYDELRKSIEEFQPQENELVLVFREVLETLTEDNIKKVEERLNGMELAWCILNAQTKERDRLLEAIDDVEERKMCLSDVIRMGNGVGYTRGSMEKTMPLTFFEKCNAVMNDENDRKED